MPHDPVQHDEPELSRQLRQSHQELAHARLLIDKLKTEIAYLRRMHFGRSTEQLDSPAQMELLVPCHAAVPPPANDEHEGRPGPTQPHTPPNGLPNSPLVITLEG